MIGQQLGGRYEMIARIGGGGMALVYKAHDILLNRNVAVKVLRQQFVHDEEFIRRFRREAQSAASLSHPNVVSIYDVGQQDDVHYIVMEYIEGTNLNEKIKEQAPLQIEEAVHIAGQICDALEHAHQHHIIHRDIKPHNILIGRNGRVKVTDFGIARAATSSDLTQTGAVMGSVHYFSPEHAKGVSQGEKSDLYSLGIVLYQMLTGRLPFLGESPISVALKHLQEDFEEPRRVNSLIPQSVENIILKSMRKNPDERYQSAGEMLKDLETCLLPERRNEPKLTFFPGASDDEDDDDEQKTRVIPAIRPSTVPVRNSASARQEEPDEQDEYDAGPTPQKKKRPWLKPTVWTVVVLALLLGMWLGVMYVKNLVTVPEVTVPGVVSLQEKVAVSKLKSKNLVASPIEHVYSKDFKKGVVMEQDKEGMRVKEGSSIKLIVSKGIEMKTMDDYVGQMYEDVEQELKELFKPDQLEVKRINDNEAPPGQIIAQTPEADEEYDPTDVHVTVTVSKGKSTFPMPDLTGKSEADALALLQQNNLKLKDGKTVPEQSYYPKGTVTRQFPFEPNDPVEPGSEITVYVSSGYPEDAIQAIKNIEVTPEEPGKTTKVKIMVSDARGENIEWGVKDITDPQSYPVTVVLSKSSNAVISIYRNNKLWNAVPVTYAEAVESQNPNSSMTGEQTQGGENSTGTNGDQSGTDASNSGD